MDLKSLRTATKMIAGIEAAYDQKRQTAQGRSLFQKQNVFLIDDIFGLQHKFQVRLGDLLFF